MDFELLNFWIHKLGFDVRHDKIDETCYLYLSLKADKEDFMNSHIVQLSSNKDEVLQFFGFDVTVKYDNLTEKNLFEYLCTSSILKPSFIKYCSFKGPHPKNKLHEKFNKYLQDKNYLRQDDNITIKQQSTVLRNDAISYFGKQQEFLEYKEKRKIFDDIVKKRQYLKTTYPKHSYTDFSLFLVIYGIIDVAAMDETKFKNEWEDFSKQNWSGARRFCT
jgi:hypothetical protein